MRGGRSGSESRLRPIFIYARREQRPSLLLILRADQTHRRYPSTLAANAQP
jgi:hypothetical protein